MTPAGAGGPGSRLYLAAAVLAVIPVALEDHGPSARQMPGFPRFPPKARRASIITDRRPIVAPKARTETQLGPVSWGGLRMTHPSDPAALFIELYDQLPDEVFLRPDPEKWKHDPDVQRQAQRVCDYIQKFGEADLHQVQEIIDEDGHRGTFAVLRGIDLALEIINPWFPSFLYGNLAELTSRYAETGRLNASAADGALLPRGAYPNRPQGPAGKAAYFGVHRVTLQSWEKISYEMLPTRRGPSIPAGEPVQVGCAPLLETFEDVAFDPALPAGYDAFSLAPIDSASLRRRISSVIRKLDDAGAVIGVIPEGTLTDGLLNYWKEEAVSTAARGKPLRWLLVGTGPLGGGDPPPNRAVLIDRQSGKEILSQDKLTAFVLSADQAALWKIPGGPIDHSVSEHITRGSQITVLETSLGRLAIVICEDLSQSKEWARELIECGISHVFVPIFSKAIMPYRWVGQAAEHLIADTGAWLIVANSLVVQFAMDPTLRKHRNWYTSLVVGPRMPDRREYDNFDWQFRSAKAGDDLGLAKIRAARLYDQWLQDPPEPSII
jgi:predicted amidohydrolase